MAKVVFSPPKKILRLNKELAKELNTNIDNIFNDSEDDFDTDSLVETSSKNENRSSKQYEDNPNSPRGENNSKRLKLLDLSLSNRGSGKIAGGESYLTAHLGGEVYGAGSEMHINKSSVELKKGDSTYIDDTDEPHFPYTRKKND